MKKLSITLISFAFVFLFVTGCSPTKSNSDTNTKTKETKKIETVTPLMVLKENQEVMKTIKGFKYTRTTIEVKADSNYNNTEIGEEQLTPQISHFTNSINNEYYYEKKYVYIKQDGQWYKQKNPDGEVLATIFFPNLVNDLVKYLGTREQAPGITLKKTGSDYVVTLDLMVVKRPSMTETEFSEFKKRMLYGKESITIDGKTYQPKKYEHHSQSRNNEKQDVEMTLTPYNTPISIPSSVLKSAKVAQ
jgi:hypothetical protein